MLLDYIKLARVDLLVLVYLLVRHLLVYLLVRHRLERPTLKS
jgi:hypothetical protein